MLLLGNGVANIEQRLLLGQNEADVKHHLLCLGTDILGGVAQRELLALLCCYVQTVDTTSLGHYAILLQLPLHSVGLQSDKEVLVINLHLATQQINGRCPDRLILTAYLVGVCLRCAVGGNHTVVVE